VVPGRNSPDRLWGGTREELAACPPDGPRALAGNTFNRHHLMLWVLVDAAQRVAGEGHILARSD
jgi:hypothetical protein